MADLTSAPPQRYVVENLDYGVNWADWLAKGESIVSAVIDVQSGSITISRLVFNTNSVFFWLSEGVPPFARIGVTITTSNSPPRTGRVEFLIPINA